MTYDPGGQVTFRFRPHFRDENLSDPLFKKTMTLEWNWKRLPPFFLSFNVLGSNKAL